jgi:hypothetical protein
MGGHMYRCFAKVLVLALATAAFLPQSALAQTKGNGLPGGQKLLFNLEVIAYDPNNCPQGDFTGSNTHRIAVKADVNDLSSVSGGSASTLVRVNDIMLAAAPPTDPNFRVLAGNACVNGTATFQLPTNPCSSSLSIPCSIDTDPTFQNYEVYGRLVGAPHTGVTATTCATDPVTLLVVCSTESWVSVRASKSAPKFTNVSKQLLSICLDTNADGKCDTRYALFAPELTDFFWNWDTTGKAHAQLFFVALPD